MFKLYLKIDSENEDYGLLCQIKDHFGPSVFYFRKN